MNCADLCLTKGIAIDVPPVHVTSRFVIPSVGLARNRSDELDERDAASSPRSVPQHSSIRALDPTPLVLEIRDPSRIWATLSALVEAHARGHVSVESHGRPQRSVACVVSGPHLLTTAEFALSCAGEDWTVCLDGPVSEVRFSLRPAERGPTGQFHPPNCLFVTFRRSERRVPAPPGTRVTFLFEGRECERRVRDIGYHGLAFTLEPGDEARFAPGTWLSNVEVSWKHGPTLELDLLVRHLTPPGGCGAEAHFGSASDRRRYLTEVTSVLHPHTIEGALVDAEQLWQLYAASGYFSLGGRDPVEFAKVRDAFGGALARLARAPELATIVARPGRGRIEASMIMLRAWSRAFVAYQGARYGTSSPFGLAGNRVLLDMYLHAYESVEAHPDWDWHVTYIRKDARFTALANLSFAQAFTDNRRASVVPFRAVEIDTGLLVEQASHDFQIDRASSAEEQDVVMALEDFFPAPMLHAYQLSPADFELCSIGRVFRQHDLVRRRTLLVVRQRGRAELAALVDLVEPGVYLAGLLDAVHLVPLGARAKEAVIPLMEAVRRFYQNRGVERFMLFDEHDHMAHLAPGTYRDLGLAYQLFVARELTAPFLDHLHAITAPRWTANLTP